MIKRYNGISGQSLLIEALRIQQLVAGDVSIATKLSSDGKLLDVKSGKIITQQGDADNDLYLIVAGEVGISVNGREIATRGPGSHFGEMTVLDSTARRSATVIAKERTILLQVTEVSVTKLASAHPEFWRRMAVALASRLRERSRLIAEPHSTPIVFIGSSREAITETTWLSSSLGRRSLICRPWSDGVFQLSKTAIEDLMIQVNECDFAILVLTPDDVTSSRGKKSSSPRDNVVFELGLFMGALGRERTFIVAPSNVDLKLPTDLLGMTQIRYSNSLVGTIGKRLSLVSKSLWRRISQLGAK